MKIIFLIFLISLLVSCEKCNMNRGDFGGYTIDSWSALERYIVLDKVGNLTHTNPIGYTKHDYTRTIEIDSNNSADTIYLRKEETVIGNYVDFFTSDYKKFILVAQIDMKDRYEFNSYEEIENILNMRRKKELYQYWIINKIDDIIYGPFTQSKFIEKRKELGVPKELKMKFDK